MPFTMPTALSAASPQRKRERQRSARREAILAAARRVFARKGVEGTTIADVAREAGVAAGTVYLYYSSKLDLFAALNRQVFQILDQILRETPAPPDLVGGTRARIHAIFQAAQEHRDLVRLVFLNPDPKTEVARRMKRADEERLEPLAEILRGGMRAGVVRQGDPTLLARIINGVVIVGIYQCFVQGDGDQVQVYEDTLTDMIVGALRPAAPALP